MHVINEVNLGTRYQKQTRKIIIVMGTASDFTIITIDNDLH